MNFSVYKNGKTQRRSTMGLNEGVHSTSKGRFLYAIDGSKGRVLS